MIKLKKSGLKDFLEIIFRTYFEKTLRANSSCTGKDTFKNHK